MGDLKLHSEGADQYMKSIKDTFESAKQKLKSNIDLSEIEKEAQLTEARVVFLKEKKELKDKLF